MPRTGQMWNYFSIVDEHAKKAKCNYCKKCLSFKTTVSNLKNHLKIKHSIIYEEIFTNNIRNLNEKGVRINNPVAASDLDESLGVYVNACNILSIPRPGSRKGQMWNYFSIVDDHAKKAECHFCKKYLSFKTTVTNLKNHLKQKHLTDYKEICANNIRNLNEKGIRINDPLAASDEDESLGVSVNAGDVSFPRPGTSTDNLVNKERTMTPNLTKSSSTNGKRMTNFDKLLLNMIVVDCQPFSIVNDEGFKSLIHGLNPNYKLPDRKTLSTTLLSLEYEERVTKIKSVVGSECSSMCITVECWTSRTMQSYMAITGHFITETNLDFKSVLLQCSLLDESDTGENIGKAISSAIEEWNLIGKINFLVTDNASNMLSAANLLGYPHYVCYAHTLNLVAQNALAFPEVRSTIAKIKKIVAHFKRNYQAKEKLVKYQINSQGVAEGSALTLIMSVPTRWNSTFKMLERFIHLQEAIMATVPHLNVDLPVIPIEEWKSLEQLSEVLKPLNEATTIMSAENYLMASESIVITQGLFNIYEQMATNDNYTQSIQTLAKNINLELKHRLASITKNLNITVCTLLDPRFKQFAFDIETLVSTKIFIIDKICETICEDQSESITESLPAYSVWNVIHLKISASQKPRSTFAKVTEEVDMYLKQAVITRESCPLEWWRGHKTIYPFLFTIFAKYFNIIVTSVPCERAFSKAGHIINDRRTSLTSSKLTQLMFLHGNKNF